MMVIDVKKVIRFQVKLWILLFCIFAIISTYFRRKTFAIRNFKNAKTTLMEGKLVCRGKVLPPCALPPSPVGPPVLISACSLVVWPHIQLCIKKKMKGKRKRGGGNLQRGKIATASRKDVLRKLKKKQGPAPFS
jgi:hypothetical protein